MIIFLLASASSANSQQNSISGSFAFLDLPASALVASLGGTNVSLMDADVNLIFHNPVAAGEDLAGELALSYQFLPADIALSNLSYLHADSKTGSWSLNIRYLDYGQFERRDATGAGQGSFDGKDYAVTIGKSHQIGHYRIGASLKVVHSMLDSYSAVGLGLDLGSAFVHPTSDFSVGMVIKNLGVVINDYTSESGTQLPFDVRIGSSFKPEYMPVRFSVSFYDLVSWQEYNNVIEAGIEEPSVVDEIFRHLTFGAQFLLGNNLELLFGYDHRQRKEMNQTPRSGSAGFSYGLVAGIRSFKFGFGRNSYHLGGATNTFTISSNLNRLINGKSAEL